MDMPVFILTMESGFFSTIFHICTLYLEHGSKLVVNSTNWKYGTLSEYFPRLPEGVSSVAYRLNEVLLHVDLWTLGDYRKLVRDILRPSAILRHEVQRVKERIGCPYTSIFVRRGDKIVSNEAKFIPMSDILSHIPYKDDTVFFLQTDDYTVVEEARALLPNHTIHCTVPPTKRGSYHDTTYKQTAYVPWTRKTIADGRLETMEMLVGLFVCLEADQCWSDDTSNVGRFLKLYDDRVHIYPNDYVLDETLHVHPAWSIRE